MFSSLVTKSITDGNVSYLEKFPKSLLNSEETACVNYVVEYWRTYSAVITEERFKASPFSHFWNTYLTTSPFEDVYQLSLETKINSYALSKFRKIEEKLAEGGDVSYHDIASLANEIVSFNTDDYDDINNFDRNQLYDNTRLTLYDFGFETLDKATGKIAPGDFVIIAARPEVGKTWLLSHFVARHYQKGKRVLFVSAEMTNNQLVQRLDAMNVGFNSAVFRSGDKTELEKHKESAINFYQNEGTGNIIMPKIGMIYLSSIISAIDTHKPDIVCIDSVYLMRSETGALDWRKHEEITNGLKQTARHKNVPIVVSTQMGRNTSSNLDGIAKSDTYSQDADTVIVLEKEGGDIIAHPIKTRHGTGTALVQLRVNWNTSNIKEIEI